VTPNPIEEMDEDTMMSLESDKELLYKNMVAAGADWLYNLEQWDEYFTEDEKKALYKEQMASTPIKKEEKVYPNDPCPCGSGKNYKKFCCKNA
ncbi:MAG: SEC-C domain-containing protein, partial [Lachnospiraceae bacterium]|nr:SEC-C domain-containing protein [Lachnospiraceae bacterium]